MEEVTVRAASLDDAGRLAGYANSLFAEQLCLPCSSTTARSHLPTSSLLSSRSHRRRGHAAGGGRRSMNCWHV
ncbi:hypothetical protein SAMN00790413_04291 [Deinococcus hopiensis KR-140]|uniref:Uncharacterized protein n=1 Tax=Deinococcus hopiensis KR-140 TaxID=695939 RepID=A0A1W1UPX5_9DEIO|nr:hypothetical protein SAMN00790413_04291 [Deinococcus hopiensis KR-140]